MSKKKKDWDKVLTYAAGIAKDMRNPNKGGNKHLSWGAAQKKAWKDPRVVKRKAEYHIRHNHPAPKTNKKPPSRPSRSKPATRMGARPRGRPRKTTKK